MKIDIEYYDAVELPDEVFPSLEDQGVIVNKGWDYCIFLEEKYMYKFSLFEGERNRNGSELETNSYTLSKILNGCSDNRWYLVKDFLGKKGILGVAYDD